MDACSGTEPTASTSASPPQTWRCSSDSFSSICLLLRIQVISGYPSSWAGSGPSPELQHSSASHVLSRCSRRNLWGQGMEEEPAPDRSCGSSEQWAAGVPGLCSSRYSQSLDAGSWVGGAWKCPNCCHFWFWGAGSGSRAQGPLKKLTSTILEQQSPGHGMNQGYPGGSGLGTYPVHCSLRSCPSLLLSPREPCCLLLGPALDALAFNVSH